VCNFDNNCKNCVDCLHNVQNRIERIQKEFEERKAKCIPLSQLQPGQKGTIARINLSGDSLHRLLQTGATLGTPVEVDKAPVQGSSLLFRLKGSFLTMTVEDAEQVLIDLIE
jgi:Fe2+ transport system protein FeoA